MEIDDEQLVSDHFPYLPIHLRVRQGSYDLESDEEALLDTGYSGELIIPKSLLANGSTDAGTTRR